MKAKEDTIIGHLAELRKRLIVTLIFFFLAFCLSLIWSAKLYAYLTSNIDYQLVVLGPDDILWIYVSIASVTSLALSSPFICYQIWAYVRPALEKKEARALLVYVPSVFICFVMGLAFGFYFVTPNLLRVLLSFGENLFSIQMTAKNYLSFVLHTTLPLAFIFEMPVVVAFLTSIGLVTPQLLTRYRRYAYFILIVLAVVLTPADLVSDLAMTVPLIFIYEISIILSIIIIKRKRKK